MPKFISEGVGEGDGLGDGDGLGEGLGDGEGDGLGLGEGLGATMTGGSANFVGLGNGRKLKELVQAERTKTPPSSKLLSFLESPQLKEMIPLHL